MNEPTHLDLFSGIGGFALAARWAGFRTVAFCEIEPHCQKVLTKNFGCVLESVPPESAADSARNGGSVAEAQRQGPCERIHLINGMPLLYPDIRRFDGRLYRGCDLLTAGVPCQPASCAGKRRGREDDRWLWPEALRVTGEALPTFAVFENPLGLLTLEGGLVFEGILSALESHGYEVLPALDARAASGGRQSLDPAAKVRPSGTKKSITLNDAIRTMPSLAARDWKSEKSNQHGKNARPLSEVMGAKSGLKLTSAFCEAYQGFPLGWTEIDEPESTRSATRSSRRKFTRSSKASGKLSMPTNDPFPL